MEIIDPGHSYRIENIDHPVGTGIFSTLIFVKRVGDKYPGNKNAYSGTTSQEVLRALYDRALYINRQEWCWQTWLSIFMIAFIVWLYEHRAARRHGRRPPSLKQALHGDLCPECNHVLPPGQLVHAPCVEHFHQRMVK